MSLSYVTSAMWVFSDSGCDLDGSFEGFLTIRESLPKPERQLFDDGLVALE